MTRFRWSIWRGISVLAIMTASGTLTIHPASALDLGLGGDWQGRLDNTVQYNLGMRAESIDPKIGNGPGRHESDYKFKNAGDIVSNRVSLLSELDISYQQNYGIRVSGSAWKDFAYDDDIESNPTLGAPLSRANGKYSGYTKKYYIQGAELLDAFAFGRIGGDFPTYFKAGRLTEYWGNSLYFGGEGISYSQGSMDLIKASSTPGLTAKELFMPRAQLTMTTSLTDELALGAQYFFEFRPNRAPEGGTYLGPVDGLFQGPDRMINYIPGFGYLPINRGTDYKPKELNKNFGVNLRYAPGWLDGSVGFYYRHLDEVQPWVVINQDSRSVHMVYPQNVDLFGVSMDKSIGPFSTGFELNMRRNTALQSTIVGTRGDLEGARGNAYNLIANGLYGLERTALWDTGSVTAELAMTYVPGATKNEQYFNVKGQPGCGAGDGVKDGCRTKFYAGMNLAFEPQWLQVWPGVDLSAPMNVGFGLVGASPLNGSTAAAAGSANYSVGVRAEIQKRVTATLAYADYIADYSKTAKGPAGDYATAGRGSWMLKDRGWLSLTVKASF